MDRYMLEQIGFGGIIVTGLLLLIAVLPKWTKGLLSRGFLGSSGKIEKIRDSRQSEGSEKCIVSSFLSMYHPFYRFSVDFAPVLSYFIERDEKE